MSCSTSKLCGERTGSRRPALRWKPRSRALHEAARHAGVSDDRGRVRIEFPLPPLGKGNLALVIHAQADAGKDEIRFAMRSRPK